MSNEKNKFLFPYKQFVTNSTYDNKFFDIDIESYKGKLNIINFDKILESRYQKNTLSKALSNIFKIMMVSSLFGGSVIYSNQLKAGAVRDDVPYQTFKDFGSNKGVFQPGAVNIPIFNKDGVQIGILDQAPMPDFSSVDVKQKVATLIAPGYVASVKHNTGYKNVRFGSASDALYTLVDRNNHGSIDYHTPRLDKIVTEVAPVEYTNVTKDGVSAEKSEVFLDSVRYPVMYRVGTGTSKILDADNNTQLVDRDGNPSNIPLSYDHITGGTIRLPTEIKTNGLHLFSETKDSHSQNANKKHPLTNNVWEGDSGSPLFAYDTVEKKWIVLGYSALITVGKITRKQQSHWWLFPDYDFTEEKISEDTAPEIQLRGTEEAVWRSTDTNGGAEISQNNTDFSAQGKSSNTNQTVALNDGKNLIITNLDDVQSTIVLENNIHQGAGSITFKTDAIVKSNNDSNWQGAGIIVEKDKSVEWKIDGVEGDALHRLGEGTLIVNGTGVNKGDLNTGDGVTILAQQADEHGNVQAFNSVRIVSGRSKVVLADSKQVNADNILWGFRGGELDVNGNDLIFNRIRATDYGAILNNSSSQTANITFNSDKKNYIFHGKIEGNIDLFNEAPLAYEDQNFILDGSLELENNQFTKENGALVFQGHAISHAIGSDKKATYLTQEDWEDRSFKLKQLNLINTDFTLGRNATLTGNISSQNSIIKIGSDNAFVDTNDGDNVDYTESLNAAGIAKDIQKVVGGLSLNGERSSQYYGIMDLDNSQAIVNDYWNGGVIATDSKIELVQGQQVWNKDSQLTGSSLDIQSAQLTVEDKLKLNASQLNLSDKGELIGDIQAKADSHIQLGDGTEATAQYQGQIALENSQLQVKQNWEGGVQATDSSIEMLGGVHQWNAASILENTTVKMNQTDLTVRSNLNGIFQLNSAVLNLMNDINANKKYTIDSVDLNDSTLNVDSDINGSISKLNSFNSSVSFKINNNSPAHFSILNVDEFNVNNTYFSLNTDTINSDKIIINHKAEGSGNQLDISLLRDKNIDIHKDYDVLLVSAPLDTKDDVFNTVPVLHGFSELKPELKKQIINNNKEWRLSQVVASENKKATSMANHFLNSDYGLFIHNLGNLDQRFGDLRESQEHSLGGWGRVKTGKGEFLSEVTDKYTQYQLGFDQQLNAKNGTLIAGLVGIMTQGDTTSSNYKINSKSYAAGLYGTYLSDKGAYIDVLGQYVQHRNDYSLNYLGVNKTKADYHSIQLETEVGYRFHPTDRFYIEPQAKLAYANVSGKDFNWVNQQDISMSMSTPSYNLLVSRAGLHIGKFIDTDKANWQIHMGVDYEKDLINTQENRLSDRISTYYSEPEKDDRTLVSFGGSVKIKDRLTAGLDVERSFGGRYDIKNALNFNLKYTFK